MTRSSNPPVPQAWRAAQDCERASAPRVGGRLPDFVVVGHSKSGTTALYHMLRSHPQIYMPMKETWFFVPELHSRFRSADGPRPDTLEEYTALFGAAGPEQRAGEASPSYLRSHTAASRIAEVAPAARIVAILREPASYLRSLHLQFVQTHVETETDLRRALSLEEARRGGEHIPRYSPRPQGLQYSEHVRYVEQLRRYHAVFPAEQVLVLIYDDFRADNEATVQSVLRFLEVDDTVPIAAVEANPTVRIRYRRLHQAVHEVILARDPAARAVKTSIKALAPRRLRRGALELVRRRVVVAPPPPVDRALMLELRRRFKGEVEALSEYLGRNLVSLWGYDEIE
jgi:Sulfotransferase family